MKKQILLFQIIALVSLSNYLQAQSTDSTYTYTYNCSDCGNFETISMAPVELETAVNISTETLEDTSTTTLAEFTFTASRLVKPIEKKQNKHDFRFNLYPNPTSTNFYVNLEIEQSTKANIKIIDILGRLAYSKIFELTEGMNVYQLPISNLNSGQYSVNILLENKSMSKRLLVTSH